MARGFTALNGFKTSRCSLLCSAEERTRVSVRCERKGRWGSITSRGTTTMRTIMSHLSAYASFAFRADYMLMGRFLLQQLVCPDVTRHSLWSSHPPLVSGDILETAGIGGDAVDGCAPRKQ